MIPCFKKCVPLAAGALVGLAICMLLAGGAGASENITVIRTLEELDKIRENLSGYYVLGCDIDAYETRNWDNGNGWLPIPDFSGTLDGRGYTIKNLYISRSSTNNIGLFANILSAGKVINLKLDNMSISGRFNVGGIAGTNSGTVENCVAGGYITGVRHVGGLIGYNSGAVRNCYSKLTVNGAHNMGGLVGSNYGNILGSFSEVSLNGNNFVGGFAGYNKGTIAACYSVGSISGVENVGGLVGNNDGGYILNSYSRVATNGQAGVGGLVGRNGGTIDKCYSTGVVSGNPPIGGLVGINTDKVLNSFWDNETSGRSSSAGGRGKTTENMRNVRTYTDNTWSEGLEVPWDFVGNPYFDNNNENFWNIMAGVNDGYPFLENLWWSYTPGPLPTRPSLLVPENGALMICQTIYFGWTATKYTLYYRLMVDNDPSFDSPAVDVVVSGDNRYSLPQDNLPNSGVYYWKVVATNATGENSSEVRQFDFIRSVIIYTLSDLDNMRQENTGDKYYLLSCDIDASETRYWNGGAGWAPISEFRGILDGNGYKIKNLYINRPAENDVGIFRTNSGIIKRLVLDNCTITGCDNIYIARRAGLLSGINSGKIENCRVENCSIAGCLTGGLVGSNQGLIENCTVVGSTITGPTKNRASVGGIAGTTTGTILNCRVIGTVVSGLCDIGGIVGGGYGTVENCCVIESTINCDYNSAGGLVGYLCKGNIRNSYAKNNTIKYVGRDIGGLVGDAWSGAVENSFVVGGSIIPITDNVEKGIGGLVGYATNYTTILNCYASYVSVEGKTGVGGLIGIVRQNTAVSNCYSMATVVAKDNCGGGLIGILENSRVGCCYSASEITKGDVYIGGLVGYNIGGEVTSCFWDITLSGIEQSDGGTGKKPDEMFDVRTYTDNTWSEGLTEPWDFVGNPYGDTENENIWDIVADKNGGYPILTPLMFSYDKSFLGGGEGTLSQQYEQPAGNSEPPAAFEEEEYGGVQTYATQQFSMYSEYDNVVLAGTRSTLVITIYDGNGNPLAGIKVLLRASFGGLSSYEGVTDENGRLLIEYIAPEGLTENVVASIDVFSEDGQQLGSITITVVCASQTESDYQEQATEAGGGSKMDTVVLVALLTLVVASVCLVIYTSRAIK